MAKRSQDSSNAVSESVRTPVLIVGGGPVGLSMALLLDRFGIDCILVERSPTTTNHPKARGLTARTMEFFRVWGIEQEVRAGGLPEGTDIIRWCEKLSGPFVGTTRPEGTVSTPAPKSIVAQNVVEAALEGALDRASHVDKRRRTELVELTQDAAGVTATIRDLDTDTKATVHADYVIACDGASSGVRRSIGIEMDGPPELARFASHYYRAELGHIPHLRGALGTYVVPADPNRDAFQLLGANPESNRFLFLQRLWKEDDVAMSEAELAALVREYWEMPDLEIERLTALTWRISAQVARQFRKGRVLLAGDAAHRFSNSGGMGLNSGVQDAHNLAWKLAFVLKGIAEPELLDTYEVERKPVAQSNTDWSTGNLDRLQRTTQAFRNRHADHQAWRAALIDLDNHLHSEGQALGYIYERGALIDDGAPMPEVDPRYYQPTDRPGARFPHVWTDVAWTRSSIDWFDTDFVLVCGARADDWRAAGEALKARGVPIEVHSLIALASAFDIHADGAVLVRPDGHVAWRSIARQDDAQAKLEAALSHVLAGGSEARSTEATGAPRVAMRA